MGSILTSRREMKFTKMLLRSCTRRKDRNAERFQQVTHTHPSSIRYCVLWSSSVICCSFSASVTTRIFSEGQFFIIRFQVFVHSIFLLHYLFVSPFPKTVATDTSKEPTRRYSSIFLHPKGKRRRLFLSLFFLCCK
jgi:ABC-type maltose transport system permease subunit